MRLGESTQIQPPAEQHRRDDIHTCRVLTMIEEELPRPTFCGTGCLTTGLLEAWCGKAAAVEDSDGLFDVAFGSRRDDEVGFAAWARSAASRAAARAASFSIWSP